MVIGHTSLRSNMWCSTAQGLVLGHLLYFISINDLPAFMKSKTYLYTDDTTIFNIGSKIDEHKRS